jgi:UDP-N-acetylglucosamine 2-epimerase (non-hydrolysing)
MRKILFCFGTRPETIKMAPIIHEAQNRGFETSICITGQHKEMLIPFMEFFSLKENYSLHIMKERQSLAGMTASILNEMDNVLIDAKPDYVCVQGDTTSTFTCSLASFYRKIPVLHIEAGLRTNNIHSPFPEEINRQMVSTYAAFNFCPTSTSEKNLLAENRSNVHVTGNTSIDALRMTIEKFKSEGTDYSKESTFSNIDFSKKILLVTSHRRENHGKPLLDICEALSSIANSEDCQIVYPVHLNPNVLDVVNKELGDVKNIFLIKPLQYDKFIWLMEKSHIILSDSGGVQEEAPFLKKPVLILRENTERPEVVESGAAKLVGTDKGLIIENVSKCLHDQGFYNSFIIENNPYGDGHASKKIIDVLVKEN